ncbi:MAG: methyltransferase domain-containing protein [Polyangiales bacterium]
MQTSELQTPSIHPILAAQRDSWNAFSGGWEAWDDFTMRLLDRQGAAIVDALKLAEDARVLDIASGTGEPGLTLAARAKRGSVFALDASEGMLRVARAKAAALGLTNFRTIEGDACTLPFSEGSFDAVSCRLGFMFFPDVHAAAREMFRVLRPGGVLATTVWAGPQHNGWITTLVGAIKRYTDFPSPPPGAPGMFRCAEPEVFAELFTSAGFEVEAPTFVPSPMRCDSADQYWAFMNAVVAPVVATLRKLDPAVVAQIKADVFDALERTGPGPKELSAGAYCLVAHK